MTVKLLIGLAAISAMTTSCRSGSYKISGTVEGVDDGEKIYMTKDIHTDSPQAADSATVTNGSFNFEGIADSLYPAMIYCKNQPAKNTHLIIEPGTIIVRIGNTDGNTRVFGTFCNNKWQALNDSLAGIGREINRIAQYTYNNSLTYEEQKEKMSEMKVLEQRFCSIVRRTSEENADNDFGRFMQSYYKSVIKK